MARVLLVFGAIKHFVRSEATADERGSGRSHCSTGHPDGRCEVNRIEVQPEAGHEILPIREDLGPSALEAASAGEDPGHRELLDEGITVDAHQPRSELDPFDMGKHPAEPSADTRATDQPDAEQLDRAVLGEASDNPFEVTGLQGVVEVGGGPAD